MTERQKIWNLRYNEMRALGYDEHDAAFAATDLVSELEG